MSPPASTPVANRAVPNSRPPAAIKAKTTQLPAERMAKRLFSVIFTSVIFPDFSRDNDEYIAETGNNPYEKEYEEKPGLGPEPFIQFQSYQNPDEDSQHNGNADTGKDTKGFEKFLFIFVHGHCLYTIVMVKNP
jgi:hypothetical protein